MRSLGLTLNWNSETLREAPSLTSAQCMLTRDTHCLGSSSMHVAGMPDIEG